MSHPITLSRILATSGRHDLYPWGSLPAYRVRDAFAVVHDAIETEIRIDLPGLVAAPVKFSPTEKKGSAKPFTPADLVLEAGSPVVATLSADRRITVSVLLELIT